MLSMFPGVIKGAYLKHKRNAIALVRKKRSEIRSADGLQIDGKVAEDVLSYKAYIK